MTGDVSFLQEGWHVGYTPAVDRAAAVAIGWVFDCPILGHVADRIGRGKPVVLGGAASAMIPYSIIKEVNPDHAKGSATGAMNLLVFVMTALVAPDIGWWMQKLAGGAALTLDVFVTAGSVYVIAIVVAAILTLFLKETGSAVRPAY